MRWAAATYPHWPVPTNSFNGWRRIATSMRPKAVRPSHPHHRGAVADAAAADAAGGAGPESDAPRGRCCAVALRRHDLDGQRSTDLCVHPHGDGVLAGRLDAAGQLDPATVELRAAGGGDRRGDVGGGD